ncbi:hypothetical protein [Ancylobacter amanitiformis]|uniref:ANR family transcriptional regulator n=1 Tax=Ancylobacter amanitiformis TaxID=217069 RepID=A0ABU0LQC5_9HYPH|nr:hypothetical protein [Ancylobacter amanitiformis]MDQ0510896.1 hypothetical protein [Ancylobacter amanitiformis]
MNTHNEIALKWQARVAEDLARAADCRARGFEEAAVLWEENARRNQRRADRAAS